MLRNATSKPTRAEEVVHNHTSRHFIDVQHKEYVYVSLVVFLQRRCGFLRADLGDLLARSLESVPEVLMLEAGISDGLLQVLDDAEC